jgi:hypothetical protein
MMTFAETREASEESALYGTPDEIAEKLQNLRRHGIEHILLNGPTGSREHLRRFAKERKEHVHSQTRIRGEEGWSAAGESFDFSRLPRIKTGGGNNDRHVFFCRCAQITQGSFRRGEVDDHRVGFEARLDRVADFDPQPSSAGDFAGVFADPVASGLINRRSELNIAGLRCDADHGAAHAPANSAYDDAECHQFR